MASNGIDAASGPCMHGAGQPGCLGVPVGGRLGGDPVVGPVFSLEPSWFLVSWWSRHNTKQRNAARAGFNTQRGPLLTAAPPVAPPPPRTYLRPTSLTGPTKPTWDTLEARPNCPPPLPPAADTEAGRCRAPPPRLVRRDGELGPMMATTKRCRAGAQAPPLGPSKAARGVVRAMCSSQQQQQTHDKNRKAALGLGLAGAVRREGLVPLRENWAIGWQCALRAPALLLRLPPATPPTDGARRSARLCAALPPRPTADVPGQQLANRASRRGDADHHAVVSGTSGKHGRNPARAHGPPSSGGQDVAGR